MDWLNEPWFEVPAFVTLAVAATIAIQKFWERIVIPSWNLMKQAVHLAEIHEVVNDSYPLLKEMNEQFKPNHGTSIHDHITRLDRRQTEMDAKLDSIQNSIDAHIMSIQQGGKRASDPQ